MVAARLPSAVLRGTAGNLTLTVMDKSQNVKSAGTVHTPDQTRPAPVSQSSQPPLLALASAAGNRAVTGLITAQRSLFSKDGTQMRYGDVSGPAAVSKAAAGARKVIEWWADSATSPKVTYTSYADLVKKARQVAENPPTAFIDWLDADGINALLRYVASNKVNLIKRQVDDIAARRRAIAQEKMADLGPNPFLHAPTHDAKYHTPTGTGELERSGRKAGAFTRTPVTVEGLSGKTTSTVNQELIGEQEQQGNWEKVGDIYVQICPGCGGGMHGELFEVDHQQALSDIRNKLYDLAEAMSLDSTLHDKIKAGTPDYDKYFLETESDTKQEPDVTPRNGALSAFSNDLGNLMRLCRICNGATGKSDIAFLEWYQANPFFGPLFVARNLPTAVTGSVLARTKSGGGWGKAARDWFVEHHLPILKENFVVNRLAELIRNKLAKQSQAAMKEKHETDPVKKGEYKREVEELSAVTTAFTGSTKVLADYLEKGPTRFAPGSPARLVGDVQNVVKKREKRKRVEEAEVSDPYVFGWMAGGEKFPYDDSQYGSMREMAQYGLGYQQGIVENDHRYAQGYQDALGAALSQRLDEGTHPSYRQGFGLAMSRRRSSYRSGYDHGANGLPPDPNRIPKGVDGEAQFLRDYMTGYAAGMTAPKLTAPTTSPAPPGTGPGSGPGQGEKVTVSQ